MHQKYDRGNKYRKAFKPGIPDPGEKVVEKQIIKKEGMPPTI
jgi:hypothetical protein